MPSLLSNTNPTDAQIRYAIKQDGNYRVMKKHGKWYVADETNHLVSDRNGLTYDEILPWFEQYRNELLRLNRFNGPSDALHQKRVAGRHPHRRSM